MSDDSHDLLSHNNLINLEFYSGIQVLKKQNCFFPAHSGLDIVGSLGDRERGCAAVDRQGSNVGSCVWRAVSSH